MDHFDVVSIKFEGKNYPIQEFQFHVFVESKDFLGILDNTSPEPQDAQEKARWKTKNACIINWLLK